MALSCTKTRNIHDTQIDQHVATKSITTHIYISNFHSQLSAQTIVLLYGSTPVFFQFLYSGKGSVLFTTVYLMKLILYIALQPSLHMCKPYSAFLGGQELYRDLFGDVGCV